MFRQVSVLAMVTVVSASHAFAEHQAPSTLDATAELCFEETLRAAAGAAAETLRTRHCLQALARDSRGREQQSRMLHNLGLIQAARGDMKAALRSHRRAVHGAQGVDQRNLALAQIAHKLGRYDIALEQYDRLIASDFAVSEPETREKIARNRARVVQSLIKDRVAVAPDR